MSQPPDDPRLDPVAVDHVLTTTRAVRRRLDLDRPVEDELILDCIDIAEQAPSGGNTGSRRWLVIRDQETKNALAEMYQDIAGAWMGDAAKRLAGSGHPHEKGMASSAYLLENLARVPAIVIPTIIGRHDGSGRPGLFDSVIQSAWSFCLALRARGLGSTWVTAALADHQRTKGLLGIPVDVTEIVLLPVAYTLGTDFRRATRHPAREITYFDRFARTYERGPSDPVRFADGPGTVVEVDIAASAPKVWAAVTDINLPGRFSSEFQNAEWDDGASPGLGASFVGRQSRQGREWHVRSWIHAFEEFKTFGWSTSDPDSPGARWRFDLESLQGGGTRLRYSVMLGPGPSGLTEIIETRPADEARILGSRLGELHNNMALVANGIKTTVETG